MKLFVLVILSVGLFQTINGDQPIVQDDVDVVDYHHHAGITKRADDPVPINDLRGELRTLRQRKRALEARLRLAQHRLMVQLRRQLGRGPITAEIRALEQQELEAGQQLSNVEERIQNLEVRIGAQNFAPRTTPQPVNRQQAGQPAARQGTLRLVPIEQLLERPRPRRPLASGGPSGPSLQQQRSQRRQQQRQRANEARRREQQEQRRLSTSRRNQIRRRS